MTQFWPFLTNQDGNEDEDDETPKNEYDSPLYSQIIEEFSWKTVWKITLLPFYSFLSNWGKSEDEGEKILEKEYGFSTRHPKISLYSNSYEILGKSFFEWFWIIQAKMKMKMKKFEKRGRFLTSSPQS